MRVVAGSARGRRIDAPAGTTTRPTSDRVRESIFNALASIDAIDGANVLDAFAGSGALGIEALSRGAENAVFVEVDRAARAVIASNLERTGLAEDAVVVAGDVMRHLERSSALFDLILLDPPYRAADWGALLALVAVRASPGAVVVIESGEPVEVVPPLAVIREKRYGSTVVTFSQMPSSNSPQAGEQA